jgi:hypothetical protein
LTETTAEGQRAVPMISYENVAAAIDRLSTAFGYRERGDRYTEPEGTVTHAELELDGGPRDARVARPGISGAGATR